MTYALIPIGLTVVLIYGFTFLLSRTGLLKTADHRKIWNTALLLSFFATAVLGIILAVQVNYKIDMPVVDRLIIWHVDFGVGMSFIAVFHFSWHWSYYRKLLTGKGNGTLADTGDLSGSRTLPRIKSADTLPLFSLGATALITQVILLREFLAIFHGNELVIGVILAGWLMLTGTGALIGRNLRTDQLSTGFRYAAFLILGILPILTVIGIRFFKNMVFPLGSMTGVPGILIYSLAGMAFFCMFSGFLFTWLSAAASLKYRHNLLAYSYATESTGSIAAGILFSFLLVFFLNTFQILFILLLLNLGTALIGRRPVNFIIPGVIAVVFGGMVFGLDLDLKSRSFLFRNQEVIENIDTPYGNLVVSKTGEQYNLYDNSSPVSGKADIATIEEDIHYAMLQHPDPGSVLVISGNLNEIAAELEKYPVRQVDYVEINPWILKLAGSYDPLPEVPWINIIHMDGRRFINRTEKVYDVVLLNLPPPGSARINRFYTLEFFRELKSRLRPGAVVSIPLQGMANYLSQDAEGMYSILYHTLSLNFSNVLLLPGYKTYFLASDTELGLDIPERIDSLGIATEYVNSYYLDTEQLTYRSAELIDRLNLTAEVNRDFQPLAFFLQINYWLSHFSSSFWIFLGVFLAGILLVGLRGSRYGTGLFITGFTGMGAELVILLAIQVCFGYVYQYTAVILTVFMMGLAGGAYIQNRIFPAAFPRHFYMLQLMLAAAAFLLYWWLQLIDLTRIALPLMHIGFLVLCFLVSFVSGLLFAIASRLQKTSIQQTSGTLYSADLAGSAAGALVMAVVLIPLVGLAGSLIVLVFLNLLGLLYNLLIQIDFKHIFR